ncbi:MAG: tetratricopeptide repeat protein [Chitinophagales bacterium]|nr:tetratricopeptide repeat protein [Chitinophagales bacterium]
MLKIILLCAISIYSSCIMAQHGSQKTNIYQLDSNHVIQIDIFIDALKEKSLGNTLEARKLFNQVLDRFPKNDAALFELSKLEEELANYSGALEKAQKAYELNKTNKFYLDQYIRLLTQTKNIDKAIDVLQEVMKNKNSDQILKMQYAYLLGLSNNPKKAIAIFEEMERNGDYNDAIAYEKIKLYMSQNNLTGAENELKKMVKNNPSDTRFLGNLAEFYLKSGNLEEAERAFNDLLRIEPANISALLYKAQYYQMKKDEQNYKKTIIALVENKDLNLDTKITVLTDKFANASKVDSTDKLFLIQMCQNLTQQYADDYRSHHLLADMYYIGGRYEEARKSYLKTLSLDSKEYNVWQNLFYTQNALKLFKEMADSTESALEFFPANSIVYFYNGLANYQIDKLDKAEKGFRRALRFVGENKALEGQLYSSLAELYHKQKRFKEMDESFEEALRIDPDNAYTLNNYAYYLSLRKDKLELAKKMSKKSLDIDKNSASFLDTYAWICFELGLYTDAKYYQEQALANGKEDMATIYEHYGDILFKLNEIEKALIYWTKAKESGSKNKSLPTKISTRKYVEYQD